MNKRTLALIVGIAAVGIAVWVWWPRPAVESDTARAPSSATMRVARYYWPGMYWIDIAAHKDWFTDAGLDVELVDTNPDYFASLQDMVAGNMEANTFSLFDMMLFNVRGADLVMVINADQSVGVDAVVARQGITTIPELKGKRIGVPKGSYLEYLLSVVLFEYHLAMSDVERVDIQAEAAPAALAAGDVDAVITWEPAVTQAIEKAQGVKLFDTSQIPGVATNGIAFHRTFIDTHPEAVQAFVHVWHRTTTYIEQNQAEAFAIIASIYQVTPAKVAAFTRQDKIMNLRDNQVSFTYAAGFESLHGTARTVAKFMKDNQLADSSIDSDMYFSDRFIRTLSK